MTVTPKSLPPPGAGRHGRAAPATPSPRGLQRRDVLRPLLPFRVTAFFAKGRAPRARPCAARRGPARPLRRPAPARRRPHGTDHCLGRRRALSPRERPQVPFSAGRAGPPARPVPRVAACQWPGGGTRERLPARSVPARSVPGPACPVGLGHTRPARHGLCPGPPPLFGIGAALPSRSAVSARPANLDHDAESVTATQRACRDLRPACRPARAATCGPFRSGKDGYRFPFKLADRGGAGSSPARVPWARIGS